MSITAGFKRSSCDSESIVENRTGQPVGKGNLWGGENIPEKETTQWELGVQKINLELSQGWDRVGSQRFLLLEASLPTAPGKEYFE